MNTMQTAILKYISTSEGRAGFHQVVRQFGASGVDLPLLMREMIQKGLVELVERGPGIAPAYAITERGKSLVNQ